ncbi:hypothetical protein E6P09_04850 [Haloferax mediterranei ATCC 33500]|uniref:Small CPxCG-related zinc finger protein n=1 Tax=Haloferax mediterranei (strain ATCC 33500 / DSM 1411 / JCM 8866 / NBRC 14739 / NCIMB 2177 / R-4) TaxID=523841 RepID=I3R1I1_HALMT|nr:hypothetical protein [Haloferax mediterranei]AFK18091.2 hypothetical protein HFX_0355 [Haloferax mediterranei ATCC 33500]AHZ22500.1 hypothetical protein BM92_07485 [Haloferax mediterranei ATCC 33500]EMA02636.1 hypothetical protein C439_08635 [Haloferax mediterranei ATCC 33500]MDX5988181.1 hypothetical protein [Haloferax mediterranei ATCC 33500]QCQ74626.1 hypothetical protein E6P09_04850 [Haloferax mediterranei ATCC 33500]
MWRSRSNRDRKRVVCIACGDSVIRSAAREYDKEGNRWERHGKRFEHLCKACYRELCHQPREELEGLLVDIEEHGISDEEFLVRYFDAVKERYEPPGGRERWDERS